MLNGRQGMSPIISRLITLSVTAYILSLFWVWLKASVLGNLLDSILPPPLVEEYWSYALLYFPFILIILFLMLFIVKLFHSKS